MAIDKSRTKPWMKVVIIFVIATFVLGVAGFSMADLFNAPIATTAGTGTPATGGVATSQTIDAINLKHTPQIKALEASLTAEPKNFELNVLQGNAYFDWALELSQATQGAQGVELWKAASTYYAAAIAAKPGDPNVTTDYAITLFSAGDVPGAIKVGEDLAKASPTFAPVQFNLGIFYENSGDKVKAAAAYQKSLDLDPSGNNAAAAKAALAKLK
ncbi:MAG: tetratricopeptide repeat protein [Coriobacteriia bacterium]|nr:tetratricopeptide repeat protein [Coriobacteriia bacterium]